MSQYDLMKLFSRYDSEISEGDFTPEELEAYLAEWAGKEGAPSPAQWKRAYCDKPAAVKATCLKNQDG